MPLSKEKMKEYLKEHYKNNKEKYAIASAASRARRLKWYSELMATKSCLYCGETNQNLLVWHHRPGTKKIGKIADLVKGTSMEKLLFEMSKCDVICTNCHCVIHHGVGLREGRRFNAVRRTELRKDSYLRNKQ